MATAQGATPETTQETSGPTAGRAAAPATATAEHKEKQDFAIRAYRHEPKQQYINMLGEQIKRKKITRAPYHECFNFFVCLSFVYHFLLIFYRF